MKTAIQHLIYSFENDRMQSTYSKEQILNLLNFKLEQEKQQLCYFYIKGAEAEINNPYVTNIEYYNETFKP